MSVSTRLIRVCMPRVAVAAAMLATWPLAGFPQSAPASSSTAMSMDMGMMSGMDHASMSGMAMPATSATAATPVAAGGVEHKAGPKPAVAPIEPASHKHPMDHSGMPGMRSGSMPAMNKSTGISMPAAESAKMPSMQHPAMTGMAPAQATRGDHATMSANDHASLSGMNMGAMQGGSAPPNARSDDYSDGVGYGPMMPHMHGNGGS